MGKTFPLNHLDNSSVSPAPDCWDQTPVSSPVRAGASSVPQDMGPHRLLQREVPFPRGRWLRCHATGPAPTCAIKGHDVTEPGMAWKDPPGWAWQDLGLGEHLNGCFWDRLSALLSNTRIINRSLIILFSFNLQGVSSLADLCQANYSPGLFLLERNIWWGWRKGN